MGDGRRTRPVRHDTARRAAEVRAHVLLVEDHPGTGESITTGLAVRGYEVERVPTLRRARRRLAEDPFDLVILEVALPDGSGLDLCAELRAGDAIPVILIAGAASPADRVAGFDAGADDYVVQPLYPLELACRLDAILRRVGPRAREVIAGPGGLALCPGRLEASKDGRTVRLTRSETGLLRALLERAGTAVDVDDLGRQIWRYQSAGDPNFIQQHVSRLRRKLGTIGADRTIETIYGVGYAAVEPGDDADGDSAGDSHGAEALSRRQSA